MKRKKIAYCLIIAMLVIHLPLYSLGDPPSPNKPPPPHPELPIDGGITYLMLTGIAYGLYVLRRKK